MAPEIFVPSQCMTFHYGDRVRTVYGRWPMYVICYYDYDYRGERQKGILLATKTLFMSTRHLFGKGKAVEELLVSQYRGSDRIGWNIQGYGFCDSYNPSFVHPAGRHMLVETPVRF